MMRSLLFVAAPLAISLLWAQPGFGQEPGGETVQVPPQKVSCIRLKFVSARVVADKFTARFGANARITPDVANNVVFFQADAETIRCAEEMVARLEERCRLNSGQGITVVYLKHADTTRTADGLKVILAVFGMLNDDWEWCHVIANARVNAFIISAGTEKTQQIRAILRWLDAQAK